MFEQQLRLVYILRCELHCNLGGPGLFGRYGLASLAIRSIRHALFDTMTHPFGPAQPRTHPLDRTSELIERRVCAL